MNALEKLLESREISYSFLGFNMVSSKTLGIKEPKYTGILDFFFNLMVQIS